ncbi:MAG: hypothetical protein KME16_17815 [Scytolyngbya sp. HA4215-MV1]|jgi:hypothetical protein|nr:hypothetical protein [Scytolyngbya sp. HA4215-MV1]
MVSINQPPAWHFDSQEVYVPLSFEGEVVGFCKLNHASRIVEILNEEDRCQKALRLACYDLAARSGGSDGVDVLIEKYLAKTERPKRGTGVVALLLKERQTDLDLNDDEFAKFCDTYRVSRNELSRIYSGEEIGSGQLNCLARILGISVDELISIWQGAD